MVYQLITHTYQIYVLVHHICCHAMDRSLVIYNIHTYHICCHAEDRSLFTYDHTHIYQSYVLVNHICCHVKGPFNIHEGGRSLLVITYHTRTPIIFTFWSITYVVMVHQLFTYDHAHTYT